MTAQEALDQQRVTAAAGLSETEAARRGAMFGPNSVEVRHRVGSLALLLRQLQGPVVYILAGAAVLAAYFKEIEEAIAIAIVLSINTVIGFYTEFKATRSIEALSALEPRTARVRRDGRDRLVRAEKLVPGDIVLLDAGDAIPADLRVLECSGLQVDESALTGESVAVAKAVSPVPPDARPSDRHSMLYKGTAITRGTALAVVMGTGLSTQIGQVSQLVAQAGGGSSPIERKLAHLSVQLVWAALILAGAIAGFGILTGRDAFLMAEAAVALAVAAIPEGLPIVATLALARGMWRMARKNALVERLSAVETLGATTVILTDKTGTLTENRMAARRLWLPAGMVRIGEETKTLSPECARQRAALIKVAVLCNDAALDETGEAGAGDPMELALLRAGLATEQRRGDLLEHFPIVRKVAFDSATKMMATVHRREDGHFYAVKGAPEPVLAAGAYLSVDGQLHPFTAQDRRVWTRRVEELARHGLRVLACAAKTEAGTDANPYEGLTFLGLIGLEDPARLDVPPAIEACHRAGIKVVMVTGDHAATARSIGRKVGLRFDAGDVAEGIEMTRPEGDGGKDFTRVGIFARVSPKDKLDLVRAYQDRGEIVAMTGDGVNDAPALRQADIGVAMGLRGTDVAREAAAMILLDDAFATIVAAIREGRNIFGNIRRFAAYLLACNLSEILVVGVAVLAGLPLPILPLQILYLNLITDVFPAFALALGEGESDVLDQPPRPPREPLLGRPQWTRIAGQSLLMTAGTFAAMGTGLWLGYRPDTIVTVTFLTLAFAQLWQVFNMRSDRTRALNNEITRNPWIWASLALCVTLLVLPPHVPALAGLLGLVPLDAAHWRFVVFFSALPMLLWQVATMLLQSVRGAQALPKTGP
ncbi:ATPase [Defluviimonas sp. 20V17]|nr:ATPase [Defluviimonas sp. 20V17]